MCTDAIVTKVIVEVFRRCNSYEKNPQMWQLVIQICWEFF